MARVISIFNQKGGVGKTTTAMNLASYLAFLGKKTLLVDFDPQFNATVGLGLKYESDETVYHAAFLNKPMNEVVKPTHLFNFKAVPSSADLAGAMVELANQPEREKYLKNIINKVRDDYDFIFIDMAPSLSLLTINGLVASDEVIVPLQCEYYSLEGVNQLLNTINLIKNNMGHPLKIAGALITMYDDKEEFSRQIASEIKRKFPHYVYRNKIPKSVSLTEAPSFHRPVILYDPRSNGAKAYEGLAKEIIEQTESGGLSTGERNFYHIDT